MDEAKTIPRRGPGLVLVVVVALVAMGIGVWIGPHLSGEHAGHPPADEGAAAVPGDPPTLYTCGMDPEIISDKPGYCPKCEMRLTPMDKDRAAMILEARGQAAPAGPAARDRKVLYWRAPMDPTYIRNQPGKSPMGMDLVPVYEDEVAGGPSIRIDPVTEQNMGLRYDVVRLGPLERTVRTVGMVDYDEQSLGAVTTKVDGWVEKLHVKETGTQVHAGDPLFELYARDLWSAQEELLIALSDLERAGREGQTRAGELARARQESARDRLRFFDISPEQIDEIVREGSVRKTLTITARHTGIVIERNVTEGDFLPAGQPAYKIADLSNVWVLGKVYESDLPFVKLGQEALMRLDYLPGRAYQGRVTYIYPYLEKGTREIAVRIEFHNPGYELKPGMYATIELVGRVADEALLVPGMAVIDTGERQLVFVAGEPGRFQPRQVRTGMRTGGDELQVLAGLAPGEKVVVSGQFMLDSESRLREATLKMLGTGLVNTSDFLTAGAPGHAHPDAATLEGPGGLRYVCPMPSHAGILHDQPGDCPLCRMRMVPVPAAHPVGETIAHYTCPMPEHYHVHEEGPGKCPECGMTLIPITEEELERLARVPERDLPKLLHTCPMPSHATVVRDAPGVCPECNMKLVPTEAVPHGRLAEEHWRQAHPEAGAAPTLYTCPMESHKHIVADQPGRCPDCEMRLVPTSEVEHGKESEELWKAARSED